MDYLLFVFLRRPWRVERLLLPAIDKQSFKHGRLNGQEKWWKETAWVGALLRYREKCWKSRCTITRVRSFDDAGFSEPSRRASKKMARAIARAKIQQCTGWF
jgi:hypothetical protein